MGREEGVRGASNGSTTGSMIHFILHLINEVQLLKTKMQRLWVIIEQTPFYVFSNEAMKNYTRMHSSGMRTVRNSSRLLGGRVPAPGVSQHALRQPPPPPVDRQTGVKT